MFFPVISFFVVTWLNIWQLPWRQSTATRHIRMQFSNWSQNQSKEWRWWLQRSGQIFWVVLCCYKVRMVIQFDNLHSYVFIIMAWKMKWNLKTCIQCYKLQNVYIKFWYRNMKTDIKINEWLPQWQHMLQHETTAVTVHHKSNLSLVK